MVIQKFRIEKSKNFAAFKPTHSNKKFLQLR